jgi:hypothetical protein
MPIISSLLSLTKQKEYAKLKKIGKGAGKLKVMKSKNRNAIIIFSILVDRKYFKLAK